MQCEVSCRGVMKPARFGHEVVVSYQALSLYGPEEMTLLHLELLFLAGAVAFADRVFPRRAGTEGWAREIHVKVPVRAPELWLHADASLRDCLDFVTGDRWTFEFVLGGEWTLQGRLMGGPAADVVVPFSGGLDSFMLMAHHDDLATRTLRVTANTSAAVGRNVRQTSAPRAYRAEVPIHLSPGAHAEETFRTRTFMFGCAAAVGAALSGAKVIEIAENGQGTIGAGLVPFGSETPYRTTHPLFTDRLRRFLLKLGIAVRFEHPFLWRTKGDVLRELLARGCVGGWTATVSCSRNMRRNKQVQDDRACGTCGNCLLRRMCVHAAGASDSTTYHWNLSSPTLEEAANGGASETTEADHAFASRSVAAMDAFAKLHPEAPALRRNAFVMSEQLKIPLADVQRSQEALRSSHAAEWAAFLDSLPSESWVMSYLEAPHVLPG